MFHYNKILADPSAVTPRLAVNLDFTDLTIAASKELNNIIIKELLIYRYSLQKKYDPSRIENLHYHTPQEILNNLQALGYYHAKIIDKTLVLTAQNHWNATYKVKLSRPTTILTVNLQLNNPIPSYLKSKLNAIIQQNLSPSHQINDQVYEKTKKILLNTLFENGFLAAQIQHGEVLINLENYTAKINLIIEPKQQFYFGDVTFRSDLYSVTFLEKYIPFKRKEPYNTLKIIQLKNNLLNSDLFHKVRIDATNFIEQKDNIIPIVARVYAKPTKKYIASIGFGSDHGVRTKLGMVIRSKTKPGNSTDYSIGLNKYKKIIGIDYQFLGKNVRSENYHCGIIGTEEKIKTRFNQNFEIYWKKHVNLDFFQRIFKISYLQENFKELPLQAKQTVKLLLNSVQLNWITPSPDLDLNTYESLNKLNFKSKFILNLKVGIKYLDAFNGFFQAILEKINIYSVSPDLKIMLKLKAGNTIGSKINQIPLSLRFFAGGDLSVRGFGLNTLGPDFIDLDGTTGIIGGKDLLLSTIEVEKTLPIGSNLSIIGFMDAGNAFNNLHKFFTKKIAMSTGVGLAYYTPLGPIKCYLAKPVKLPKGNYQYRKNLRIHLIFVTEL